MMKLRLPSRSMLNSTNSYRPIPSNTLHIRHNNSILLCHSYLPRCQLWLNHLIHTRKWSFNILHLLIYTRRTRPILWIIYQPSPDFSPSTLSFHSSSQHSP
uniref:Uncharacterized protein n=1 Tax=Bos mutus grunniens TaxID=30521 RepID=A0A8B9WY67_BOSMU